MSDPYGPTQNGHSVNWTLTVDTGSVVSGKVADVDKTITVTVKDTALGSVAWSGVSDTDKSGIAAGSKIYYSDEELTKIVTSDVVEDETVFYTDSSKTDLLTDTDTVYFKAGTDSTRVDIVPYVTSFTTSLSSFQSSNPSVYDRTALGHYPIYMTHAPTNNNNGTYTYETVKVNGFNLDGMSITFDEGDASGGLSKTDSLSFVSGNTYSFTLPSGAKTGNVTIGNGSVSTLNNVNNNDACGSVYASITEAESDVYAKCYNRQPNATNNNILSDDLVIDVWDFNSKAAIAENNGKLDNAIMKISPTSGMLGFAFSNGSTKFSMGGKRRNDSTEYSYYEWDMDYDYLGYTTFTYDSEGHAYGGTAGGDTNGKSNFDRYNIITDRINAPGSSIATRIHKNDGWSLRIEGIGQRGNATTDDTTVYMRKDRIQSTCFATLRNGKSGDNAGTYIYLAYYDALNDEIRFKAGELLDKNTGNTNSTPEFGTFYRTEERADNDDNYKYKNWATKCQIVASNTESGTYEGSNILGNAGNAVAIGVTSNNVVVMVWYDSITNNLMYSYNDAFAGIFAGTDTTDFNTKIKETSRIGASKEGWSTTTIKEPLISGAGEYCQLVVDANDGIHVVDYDSTGCDLKYAYLPSYDGSATSCTVDSYLDTGSRLSLDVAAEVVGTKTYYIPHIGYWAAYPEKAHYAYIADPVTFFDGNKQDGTTADDKYTGIWECGIVPSRDTVREGKINVGVWKKDVNITFTDPDTGDDVPKIIKGKRVASNYTGFSTGISEANETWGKCYGNGTDNAVLAYVIEENSSTYYIETAQMR